ncbi:MAG: hypothetical protein NTY02_14200, partial [Acidobacteria bacterium]|nr:hypothetical protein [Acidobacteriota bacterium]
MTMAAQEEIASASVMDAEIASHVTAFARACKAATRTVALYPPEHPNVDAVLQTLVATAHRATATSALALAVRPDTLTVAGQSIARPDSAVSEFAALLHAHQVGQFIIHPQTDAELWRRFLALLALPADQARLRGGIGKLWASEGQTRIEVRSLDYRELLRGHIGGDRATWDAIVTGCLEGDAISFDDSMADLLFGILDDPARVNRLVEAVEARVADGGTGGPLVIAGLLRAVAQYVEKTEPGQLEAVMSAMAEAAGRLPVDALAPIVRTQRGGSRAELGRFVRDLVRRIKDGTIADLVACEVRGGRGTSPHLADAFCGLAPDVDRRSAILTLARQSLEKTGASADPAVRHALQQSEELLLAYSDQSFVSDDYNVEFQRLADRAVELDRDHTDPPVRITAWRKTVDDDEIRLLDAELLVDLMRLQNDPDRWRDLADLALNRVNVLLVVGDFNAAAFLVEALRAQAEQHADAGIRAAAGAVITDVLTPSMMRHVATHLDTADRGTVAAARRFCLA